MNNANDFQNRAEFSQYRFTLVYTDMLILSVRNRVSVLVSEKCNTLQTGRTFQIRETILPLNSVAVLIITPIWACAAGGAGVTGKW